MFNYSHLSYIGFMAITEGKMDVNWNHTGFLDGSKLQLSIPFTVAIQPLSTRLIKTNFCFNDF